MTCTVYRYYIYYIVARIIPLRDRGIIWSKVILSELPQYEHICPRWNFTFSSSEHDSIVIVPSKSPFLYESYTLFSYTFHLYTSQHNGPLPGSHTNSKETPCTVPSLRTNFLIFLLCPLSNDIPVYPLSYHHVFQKRLDIQRRTPRASANIAMLRWKIWVRSLSAIIPHTRIRARKSRQRAPHARLFPSGSSTVCVLD